MNGDSAKRIVMMVERFGRLARGVQHQGGTRPVQWEVMRYLARANNISRNPGALASFLGSTRGTVSQTLITLEKKGFIARTPSRFDGRGMEINLTDAGRSLVAANPLREFETVAEELPGCESLADNLSELLEKLQDRKGYKAFGECHSCVDFKLGRGDNNSSCPHRCSLTGVWLSNEDAKMICFKHKAPLMRPKDIHSEDSAE